MGIYEAYGSIWGDRVIWRHMHVYGYNGDGSADAGAAAPGELMTSELYHPGRYENIQKMSNKCSTSVQEVLKQCSNRVPQVYVPNKYPTKGIM